MSKMNHGILVPSIQFRAKTMPGTLFSPPACLNVANIEYRARPMTQIEHHTKVLRRFDSRLDSCKLVTVITLHTLVIQ